MAGWNAGAKMKPMRASSTQRRTPAASSTTRTPSSSSTSALPHRDDWARLPCLATRHPAAAATRAAAVEMLNVLLPSPPVPQVSTAPGDSSTWVAWSRIDITMPASSSTVSPLVRSAASRPPIWAGVALPSITPSMTARAVDTSRQPPPTIVSSAPRITSSVTRARP